MHSVHCKLIAFYLPQFHPIAENDAWWGEGFTEWTNVKRAKPLFLGHSQPRIPGELGYYDLRDPGIRERQAELAREHGIHGFCYWHYWFEGRRLLERPFGEVLASGKPDFPFCLAWANETWSRRWDGREHDVLLKQTYGGDDDARAHIRWLIPSLSDRRAIRIDNKPLLLIYRPFDIPGVERLISVWREEVCMAGMGDIYLVAIETGFADHRDPRPYGFDAALHFQPNFPRMTQLLRPKKQLMDMIVRRKPLRLYDYEDVMRVCMHVKDVPYPRFECVIPRWDNSPRAKRRSIIVQKDHPFLYGEWLSAVMRRSSLQQGTSQPVVFLNAWNEWGEGNYLEPDATWGRAYLEATRDVVTQGVASCA
ncbi:glycosyl hydrolase [Candidatus Peregrinibacteria bacterium CG22_combo_CG10-13_8_21_14_all_49_11]|nr:MAG: glycosyl hydrolase [Candidatus Peregrinibacteria bacterium CG22_combo_CG10-13_8_21_14_all_49_11]